MYPNIVNTRMVGSGKAGREVDLKQQLFKNLRILYLFEQLFKNTIFEDHNLFLSYDDI